MSILSLLLNSAYITLLGIQLKERRSLNGSGFTISLFFVVHPLQKYLAFYKPSPYQSTIIIRLSSTNWPDITPELFLDTRKKNDLAEWMAGLESILKQESGFLFAGWDNTLSLSLSLRLLPLFLSLCVALKKILLSLCYILWWVLTGLTSSSFLDMQRKAIFWSMRIWILHFGLEQPSLPPLRLSFCLSSTSYGRFLYFWKTQFLLVLGLPINLHMCIVQGSTERVWWFHLLVV